MTRLYGEALDARRGEIAALYQGGWTITALAKRFDISRATVDGDLKAAGVALRQAAIDAQPGEEWRPLPGWPFEASNMGRVRGKLGALKPYGRPGQRLRISLTRRTAPGQKDTISADLAAVVWCAFHGGEMNLLPGLLNSNPNDTRIANLSAPEGARYSPRPTWTDEDDDALRRAPTRALAIRRSQHSRKHACNRIRELGLRWPKMGSRPPELRNPERYKARLFRECMKLAPAYLSPADRDDVAAAAFLAIMERRARDPKEAVELARKAQGHLFNRWRDVSVDAPIPGTDGLTYLDRLAAGEDGLHMP